MEFIAGILAAAFIGFLVWKFKESKDKKNQNGGNGGGRNPGDPPIREK